MEKTNRFNNTGRIWPDRNGMFIMIARRTILSLPRSPYPFNQKSQIPTCQNILNFQTEPIVVPSKMYLGSLSYICDGEFLQKH